MNFLGIGESCQTAYQIRRYFNTNERYIFDWVISSLDSVEILLQKIKPEDILQTNNLQVIDDGLRLLDKATLIKHQHDFKLDENQKHIISSVEVDLDEVRKKYIYLLKKTKEFILDTHPVLVFYDWTKRPENFEKIYSLQKLISEEFDYNAKIIYVTENDYFLNKSKKNESVCFFLIDNSRVKGTKFMWRGCDEEWNRVFDSLC